MSVDIAVLAKRGVSSGEYKKIFSGEKLPRRVQKLNDLITNRIKDGYQQNLTDWRLYAAIDLAYELPFRQTTPTFIEHLISRRLKPDELLQEIEKYGLREEDIFTEVVDSKGEKVQVVNPPVLYRFLLPLVRAYSTARIAALYNDRNKSPLLPYHPLKKTAENRVRCEILTDMAETTATWYGYPNVLDQAIKQMVKYGVAVSFPREEWHIEEQIHESSDGPEEKVTVKEGLRYIFPHPSRMAYDLYDPLPDMNADTGVEYRMHWQVVPYSDILDNRSYWNRNSIAYGTNWFRSPLAGNFFEEFYPCKMEHPLGVSFDLREDKAAFYQSSDRDKAIFKTEIFMKIVPKTWGLGRYKDGKIQDTYEYPVWHRFIVAGDSTIIWAEPCAYPPNWEMAYDYDYQSARQTSLALEAIPWQDHLGNILTQALLTAKQNLANVIFYDTNLVSANDIRTLQNKGEAMYRSLNFVPYDSLKWSKGGFDPGKAFAPIQLKYQSIQDMIQMMGAVLDIMERVLQFTAQEVGSAAKHYQSATEIKETSESSDARVNYTGSSVDNAIDAWKRQLWLAMLAYKDDDVEAQIASDIPDVEKILEGLGFKVVGKAKDKLIVRGKKHGLRLVEFAKSGEGEEPDNDPQVAGIMFQTIQVISKNPELFAAIGVKRIISIIEQAAKIAGADKDFKLPTVEPQPGQPPAPGQPPTGTPPPQSPPGAPAARHAGAKGQPPAAQPPNPQDQITQLLQHVEAQVMQMVEQKVVVPAAQEMAKQQKQINALGAMEQQLMQVVQKLEAAISGARPATPPATAPAAPAVQPPV